MTRKRIRKRAKKQPQKRFNVNRANEWQGRPVFRYSDKFRFEWNPKEKRYFPVSINPGREEITGIWFTFFSCVCAYAKPGKVKAGLPYFYSNELFRKAVFRSNVNNTIPGTGLNPGKEGGEVPFSRFNFIINRFLGTENWITAFREVDFRYERGMAVHFYDRKGVKHLRKWVFPSSQITFRSYSAKRAKVVDRARRKSRRRITGAKKKRGRKRQ